PGSIGKSRHDHRSSAVLQGDQHFAVIKFTFVAADELMLKIDWPLASRGDLSDKRQTYLAVHANSLRLIRDALVRIGNLDYISGRKSYRRPGTRRIRQRRSRALAAAAQRGEDQKSANAENGLPTARVLTNPLSRCQSSTFACTFSALDHVR